MFSEKYIRFQNLQDTNNADACIDSCIISTYMKSRQLELGRRGITQKGTNYLLQIVRNIKLNFQDRNNQYCLTPRTGIHKLPTSYKNII